MSYLKAAKKIALCLTFTFLISPFAVAKAYAADLKFSMSYIYFGNSSDYTAHIDQTQDSIDTISPNYFDLYGDGTLKLTTAVSQNFVYRMQERGIKVVPFISNHWNRAQGQAALLNREDLTDRLADEIIRYNLDGINIDLENLTSAESFAYVDFVRLLRQKLPAGSIISVAVAANPYGSDSGWQGSYDYAALASYCDYLIIMAYDEHYQNGPPGAVSSMTFVNRSIQYALSLVPKEKIVLALPFYGRIWKNGGGSPQGYGISNITADALIESYRGVVTMDPDSQTSRATITILSSDPKPVVGGVSLLAGTYTIWYENEQTIKQMLALVQAYDIKGAGNWSLGQESANTWDYYKLWLNGCYLADIQTSWAKDAIFSIYQQGLMKGISAESFQPEGPLTRAQAAVILVRMLNLPSGGYVGEGFSDTAGHWAQAEIETARYNHLVNGVGNNLFEPDRPVTREEIAVMLDPILSMGGDTPVQETPAFPDVSPEGNPWSYEAIYKLSRYGILFGHADGGFHPKDILTRAQMAVILGRLQAYLV